MEENNYENLIDGVDGAESAGDFSLEEILDEYRAPVPEPAPVTEYPEEPGRPIIMDSPDDTGLSGCVGSIGQPAEEEPVSLASRPEQEPETADDVAVLHSAEAAPSGLSEYELQALVDSDERDLYASGDIDFELGEEEEYRADTPPVAPRGTKRRVRGKHSGGAMPSPLLALMALMTQRRGQRAKADEEAPVSDDEDAAIPEMEPEKAAKMYGGHLMSLSLRLKIAAGLSLVMAYITFAFFSFLPLAGAMKGPAGAGLSLLILLLTVVLCGLDVFVSGIMNIVRARPNYESLVSLSCLFAIADAAVIAANGSGELGLPFCAVAAVSMCGALFGNLCGCGALRRGFKVAASKSAGAVTAENGISGKGSALFKSRRDITGFVRRSEESDIGEEFYAVFTPIAVAASLIFGALAAFAGKAPGSFLHCLSAMTACSAAFGGGICFALPYAAAARRLQSCGAAVSGWSGLRDIGRCRGVVISDGDIFPQGTVEIAGIRVLQNFSADKVISYTGSVIAASANGLSTAFSELIRRNGYSLCRVENFTPHEGGGIIAVVNGENVMVGNAGFMNLMGVRVPQKMSSRNTVFTTISGELVGLFDIGYKPLPAVQNALAGLLNSGYDTVFALRDFNMTPDALRNKFHVSGENFNLPSYPERFNISAARDGSAAPIAAVIAREGMVPVVELCTRGRRLYRCSWAAAVLAMVLGGVGLLLMFFACWNGNFLGANAAKTLLLMLLCLIPNILSGFWMDR